MKKERLISAFSNPSILDVKDLEQLTDLVEEYPFSGMVRMLYVKALKNHDDIRFEKEMRAAAAHLPVRKKLYGWLKRRVELPLQEIEKTEAAIIEGTGRELLDKSVLKKVVDSSPGLQELQKQYLTEAVETSLGMEIEETVAGVMEDEDSSLESGISPDIHDFEEKRPPASFLDFISGTSAAEVEQKSFGHESIIDQFIKNEKREKVEFFDPEKMARASLVDQEDLVTDTLARIYMSQGNLEKALRAYETLQLKFPEKRVYFAGRIEKVQNLLQKRTR